MVFGLVWFGLGFWLYVSVCVHTRLGEEGKDGVMSKMTAMKPVGSNSNAQTPQKSMICLELQRIKMKEAPPNPKPTKSL